MTAEPTRDGPGIGAMLVSARSFDEYRAMFALTDDDLTGRILDCPGGAASFMAEAVPRGTDALAVDPVYSRDRGLLGDDAISDGERGHRFLLEHRHRFVWTWFADPAVHLRVRTAAARDFAADVVTHPHRYVAGALPALPFPDDCFDLVLSSHLLFSYGERFDYSFHLDALLELIRVARGQVRLFPLLPHTDGERYPELGRLRAELASHGVGSRLEQVEYELQRGGNEMLVLDNRPAGGR